MKRICHGLKLDFLFLAQQDQAMASQFADDTAAMYERGINLLKSNIMLYFAYADYEEGRCKYAKVHSIYKKLISMDNVDPTLVCFPLALIFILVIRLLVYPSLFLTETSRTFSTCVLHVAVRAFCQRV